MGCGTSRVLPSGIIEGSVGNNAPSNNLVTKIILREKSTQTSTINIREEISKEQVKSPEVNKQHNSIQTSLLDSRVKTVDKGLSTLAISKQDITVQTNTLDIHDSEQLKTKTPVKLLPEIKLVPDRTRTLVKDDDSMRQELMKSQTHRQYIEKNCKNVQSIAELVEKIKIYTEDELIRAWLIFYWITTNITYVSSHADNAADAVFRTRTAVCRGFTHLFSECCRLLNIESVEVPGFVKENWFRIGEVLQHAMPTHVWNAVKLDNNWYLLDVTWGAGSAKEKKIEEFYFLTSPDQMIYTHLPTEHLWQLLSPSITKQQFFDLPLVKSNYYRLNLKLISPTQCIIETSQSLFEVIIKTPSPDITLTAKMKMGDDQYPDFHQLCQYDHTSGLTRCYFSATNDGLYDITIYGKTASEDIYVDAIHMRLKITGVLNAPVFPTLYKPFNDHRCTLIEPFRRTLLEGEHITIQMYIPNATSVSVKNGNQMLSTHGYQNGLLKKELIVEGDVTVYAIFDRTETLQGICKFNMT